MSNDFVAYLNKELSNIASLQTILESVVPDSLEMAALQLSDSTFLQGDNVSLTALQIVKEMNRRFHKSKIFIKLIKKLITDENGDSFQTNFIRAIFGQNRNKLDHFKIGRVFLDEGIISIDRVCEFISTLSYDATSPFYVFAFLFFIKDIERADEELAKKLRYAFDNASQLDFSEKYDYQVLCEAKELFDEYYDILLDFLTFGAEKGSIIRVLMDDDSEALNELNIPDYTKHLMTKNTNMPLMLRNNPNPLQVAAYYGSVQCFKSMVLHCDYQFDKLVNFAAFGGNIEIVRFLIEKKVDFSNALLYSFMGRNTNLSDWIIENHHPQSSVFIKVMTNAAMTDDVNAMSTVAKYIAFEDATNKATGQNILHIISLFNSIHCLVLFSEFKYNLFNAVDIEGNTPLHCAVEGESVGAVQFFLSFPLVDVNMLNKRKLTPLIIAIMNGNAEIIYLLDQASGIDKLYKLDGKNLLALAVNSRKAESIQYALNCGLFSPNDYYSNERRVIDLVAEHSCLEIIKMFYKDDFPINAPLYDGKTPIHLAVNQEKMDSIRWLVFEKKCDLNVKDKEGKTPLHYAVNKKSSQVVQFLLSLPALDVNSVDINGESPLMNAVLNSDIEIIELLLTHPKINVNLQSYYQQNPLSSSHSTQISQLLESHGAVMPTPKRVVKL